MTAEFTSETFPNCKLGWNYDIYNRFKTAILVHGMSVDQALEAIYKEADAESPGSEEKKRSADKIAAHLREALAP